VLHSALVDLKNRPPKELKNLEASLREALPWERVRAAASHLLRHLLVEDPDARAWCGELHGDTYVLPLPSLSVASRTELTPSIAARCTATGCTTTS
jgi:hypothetical protein